jgi:pyruvate/2-oxoglutarate/acetoin dehydrogenase E1 component
MSVKILIGKNSLGENQYIELKEVPILMISYCDEDQLTSIFRQFGLYSPLNKCYLITNSRLFKTWKFKKEHVNVFIRDQPEFDIVNRNEFINQISDEVFRRKKIMKQKKILDFKRYTSLNIWNEIKLDYLFVFVDDIWDIIISKPKNLALNFMMILLYGQDVGKRLGGVFREAATLAEKFGDDRVFNTPIQEAFIIGSTVGMSVAGLKPIVDVQFADYIWPGLNQLFTEVSRSYYLSNGKWPISCVIRVPIGAYGSGGPYHSSSVESVLLQIRGIKVVYPSTGADLKGLLKAAFYDPNPVVVLEHKGLYWSKVKGTEEARTIEPSEDYVIPIGKARMVQSAKSSNAITIITYGMGVYWAKSACKGKEEHVEIIDLRSLNPIDYPAIQESVLKTGKCLLLTEEPANNGFLQALAGWISEHCFEHLDAPVQTIGSVCTPAIPLNSTLESALLPSVENIQKKIENLLNY